MRSNRFRIAVRKFGPFESAIVRQWQAFERTAQTGLELDAVAMDLHPLLESTFENGGLKRGDWDVAFINTDWVAAALEQTALLDLSELIRTDPPEGYPAAWAPSMLRLQQIGERVLGLPYHDGPECLIYRKDLFEDAPFGVPETWDEFRAAARHFHRPGQGLSGALYAAYPDGHNTVYDFCLQLWTRGGELTDTAGNIRLETPEAVEALDFLRAIINDATAVHPSCREMDSVKSGLAFAAGEAALMVNWFGFAAMAETIAESKIKGKVGVAPVPHAPGCKGTSLNIYWILSIAAGAVHKDVAWRFLRHCAGEEMDKLLTLEGAIGCRKSTWADLQVNGTIPFYGRMEELHANAREMPRLVAWPRIAEVIDRMVLAAIDTAEPLEAIVERAQSEIVQPDAAAGVA
jgi:multiple sugar transport system substrate-binding protein